MKKVKNIILSKLKWIIVAILIIVFLFLVCGLFYDKLHVIDDFIYKYISLLKNPILTVFFKIITNFSSALVLILLTILSFIIFKNKRYGTFISINLISITTLNQILKLIFARTRPLDLMIIEESGYSFPSGHSMASMAFYGFIIFLVWKYVKTNKKWIYTIVLSLLILLIGISRIYLGVHYASDVLAGFILTLAYLIIFTAIIDSKLEIETKVKKDDKNE